MPKDEYLNFFAYPKDSACPK